jgi:asparagine synthase (glutamine-hydrolysing)
MMAVDFRTYLPDDILVKVDRAAMAASLETRVPMLDHRVVELAARLPLQHKIAGATGKGILRRILDRYVPRDLVERPKLGFSVPIGDWLKGPLRDWSEDLLARAARNGDGLLDHKAVAAAHAAYLRGDPSLHYPLWTVLMYEAWREANI